MLKEKDIPTPLVEKKQRKKVEVVEELNNRRFSITYVIWRFIVYFLGILRSSMKIMHFLPIGGP